MDPKEKTQQHDQLPVYEVRPRFKIETTLSIHEFEQKVNHQLALPNAPCTGRMHNNYGSFFIHKKDQHYWSPQLTLTLEEQEGKTILRGLYGPKPAVWTMFVFFYAAIGFMTLVLTIIGFGLKSLNKGTTVLWFIPVLLAVFLSLYLVAYFGKQKGHDQIFIIHEFIKKVLST